MDFNDGTTPPKDNRMLAVALCAAAALLLVFSCITHRWLENRKSRYATFATSLTSTEICGKDNYSDGNLVQEGCRTLGNGELVELIKSSFDVKLTPELREQLSDSQLAEMQNAVKTSGAFKPLGFITLALLALGSLSLLACAVLVQLKKRVTLPIMPATIALLALMTALITGCVFLVTKPAVFPNPFSRGFQVGVGIGFWAFGIGAVLGIAGAQMAAKLMKPIDPDINTEAF